MAVSSHRCNAPGCTVQILEDLKNEELCPAHYLEKAFQRLDKTTDNFRRGHGVDYDALDWLVVQVDFIVETISEEGRTLDPDTRSKLLELILGIVNLNEYICHQTGGPKAMGYLKST